MTKDKRPISRPARDSDIQEKRAGYSPEASLNPANLPDDIFQTPSEPPPAQPSEGGSSSSDD